MADVIDNKTKSRFELAENGHLAIADYRLRDGVLTLPHVEADMPLRGTGAAGRLMEGLLTQARARGLKIRPVCPYAVAYIARHKEWRDLLA